MGALLSVCFTSKNDDVTVNQQHLVKRRCKQQQQRRSSASGNGWAKRQQLSIDVDSARGCNSTGSPSPRNDFPRWSPRPPPSPSGDDPRRPDRPFFDPPQSYIDAEAARRGQGSGRSLPFKLKVGGKAASPQPSNRRQNSGKSKRTR